MVRALLERGADPDRWSGKGWTPLHMAARQGHTASVRHLLGGGASVDAAGREESRAAPLLIAVTGGLTETAQALLDHGADPNSRNRHQVTPLMAAAYRGHPRLARLLLDRGADLGAVNQDGNTALLMAVFRRHPEVVRLLAERGARVELEARVKGFGTVAPLMLAAGRGDREIAQTLLEHGAAVDVINEMDGLGRLTPLMMAAWKGDEEMVELLLKHGADPRLTLEEGRTAADWAREGKHPELEALLRGPDQQKLIESSG